MIPFLSRVSMLWIQSEILLYQFRPSLHCPASKRVHISSHFWHSSRAIILVPTAVTKFQEEPVREGVKYMRVGKFWKYRPLSYKRYETGPQLQLLWNTSRKSWVAGRSMSVPRTLSDLKGETGTVKLYRKISVITHQVFDTERPYLSS